MCLRGVHVESVQPQSNGPRSTMACCLQTPKHRGTAAQERFVIDLLHTWLNPSVLVLKTGSVSSKADLLTY